MAKDVVLGLDNRRRRRQELPVGPDNISLWMAHIDFPSSEATGFGSRPEEALSALITSWQSACKSWDRGDPNLIHEYRDSITLVAFAPGRGYVKGVTDSHWYDRRENPEDPAFDAVFEQTRIPSNETTGPGPR